MGLSIAIAGGITMMTLLIIFGVLAVVLFQIQVETTTSSQAFDNNDEIKKTGVRISGVNASSGSQLVNFTLNNEGSEKLWNYDEFDVIIRYDADISGTQDRVTEQFTYNATAFAVSTGMEGTSPDFNIQRDCRSILDGLSSLTLFAGVHYTDPVGDAFVRIVNTRLTGDGNTDNGGTQDNDWFTVYISDPDFSGGSITFTRAGSPASQDTLFCYEIIDYVGLLDGDNAIRVLDQNTVTYASGLTTVSGPSVTPIDPTGSDIVVFITGQASVEGNNEDWNEALSTSAWNSVANTPDFTRGSTDSGGDANPLSYVVVEFTGSNWEVNRYERNYIAASDNVPLTTPVSDVNKAFLHTQHRAENEWGLDEVGEEAWLSAVNQVSLQMETAADTPFSQYYIVTWVIENTQNVGTIMNVQHLSAQFVNTDSIRITLNAPADFTTVGSSNTAIMGENARSTGGGTAYPRGSVGLELIADNQLILRRSDNSTGAQGQDQRIRFSLVEFPHSTACVSGSSSIIEIGEWTINCIKFDYFEPNVVNPNESPEILTKLQYPIFANGLVEISLSTDNGNTANKTTTVS